MASNCFASRILCEIVWIVYEDPDTSIKTSLIASECAFEGGICAYVICTKIPCTGPNIHFYFINYNKIVQQVFYHHSTIKVDLLLLSKNKSQIKKYFV